MNLDSVKTLTVRETSELDWNQNPQWLNYNKTPVVELHFYINDAQSLVA